MRVWVSLHDLATGDLPPVCAKTGVRCRTSCRVRLSNRPSWTTWLLPYSWYTDASTGRFTHRAVLGILPMTPPAHKRVLWTLAAGQHARRVGGCLFAGAFAVGLALPHASLAPRVTVAGIAAFVIAAALHLFGCTWSVGGRIERGDRWVRLVGVHPRFAAAVRGHYRARRAAGTATPQSNIGAVPAAKLVRGPIAVGFLTSHP
ncbi:MAG: hypothetical protein ACRDYA_22770 [Egibacteraceae bacterium]